MNTICHSERGVFARQESKPRSSLSPGRLSEGHDFNPAILALITRALAPEGRLLGGLLLSVCLFASIANSQTPQRPAGQAIAIRGGKLLTITHGVIENGVLIMENGKITAVGPAASVRIPRNARAIDATGMTIYPGLIDSESQLGLTEISSENTTNDLVETSDEIMPHMHVADAFHAESELIPVTRLNGITNAVVAPQARDTLPGQDAFVQLDGRNAEDMLLLRDLALPLNFTAAQRRRPGAPGEEAPSPGERLRFPSTRMGMAAQLRQAFIDAQEYAQRVSDYQKRHPQKAPASGSPSATLTPGGGFDTAQEPEPGEQPQERGERGERGGERPGGPPRRNLKLEALLPYLQGKKPVVVAAEEPNDLEIAVGLAREFNLKIVINHISHSQRILDQVAALKVPVIVGPIYENPKDYERYDAVFRLPAELFRRGVKIAFASYTAHDARNLPYQAGYAVAFGLPYEEALKAITINPAQIWGAADRLGSLDVGKTANLVVANGDPLDVKTDVKRVFIAGRELPMSTRQTRLRDEYMTK